MSRSRVMDRSSESLPIGGRFVQLDDPLECRPAGRRYSLSIPLAPWRGWHCSIRAISLTDPRLSGSGAAEGPDAVDVLVQPLEDRQGPLRAPSTSADDGHDLDGSAALAAALPRGRDVRFGPGA